MRNIGQSWGKLSEKVVDITIFPAQADTSEIRYPRPVQTCNIHAHHVRNSARHVKIAVSLAPVLLTCLPVDQNNRILPHFQWHEISFKVFISTRSMTQICKIKVSSHDI